MKPFRHAAMFIVFVLLLPGLLFDACDTGLNVSQDEQEIIDNTVSMFTRIKVGDNGAIYDNEFPYMHEERDREEFLAFPAIAAYRADTLLAIQVDSVTVWDDDTAYCHMRLEYLLSDSTTIVKNIRMRWYNVGDTMWIKPTISNILRQNDFEEELRVYWEAVRDIERREKEREKEKQKDTGP